MSRMQGADRTQYDYRCRAALCLWSRRGSGEMADAHALGACADRRQGSNPCSPTKNEFN